MGFNEFMEVANKAILYNFFGLILIFLGLALPVVAVFLLFLRPDMNPVIAYGAPIGLFLVGLISIYYGVGLRAYAKTWITKNVIKQAIEESSIEVKLNKS